METLLLIDDLPHSCTPEDLKAQLRQFGGVQCAEIVRNHDAPPFGRVTMTSYEAAQQAYVALTAQGYQIEVIHRGQLPPRIPSQ